MKKRLMSILLCLCMTATLLSAVTLPAMAGILASYGTDLVCNGDAETGDMTGWTSSGPVFMVVNPESFACPASPDRGYVFDYCTTGYYGIGRAGTESISQTIDISNLASDISSGLVNINLSAYAIKWLSASDATIKLELLNGSDTVLDTYSQSVTTGSCWQALTIDQNSIDPDTTTLRITLSATISNESPAIDYIEFDGVSLILTKSESEINI